MKEMERSKFRKTDKVTETLRHTHGSDVLILTIQDGPGVSVDTAVHFNVMVRWYAYAGKTPLTMTYRVPQKVGRSLARLCFLLLNCRVLQTQLSPLLPDSFC
jgi:hypothetical protein